MPWVREVLQGRQHLDLDRNERHPLDGVRRVYTVSNPKRQAAIAEELSELLTDPDDKLRAAAVVFFAKDKEADDGGRLLEAWTNHPELYDGVPEPWYPGARDLRALLAAAISWRVRASTPDALAAMKAEALVPGRGQNVLAGLIPADTEWVVANYEEVIRRSPEAMAGLLFWLGLLKVRPEDIIGPVVGKLPDQTIKSAIALAVPNERERLEKLFFSGDESG